MSDKPVALPSPGDLEFTGERVVPGRVDPNLFNEHLARYRLAALFSRNARVLDAGCGSGYGTAELVQATAVIAMDISREAVTHASRSFAAPNVRFVQGRCEALPFADTSLDLVVAFEVIEHLEQWQKLLSEARRVLRPAGVLLVSTPNRAFYAESRAAAGPNPYHVHEFDYREFEEALRIDFQHVHLWTQNHSEAMTFVPARPTCGTLDAPADVAPETAHFFLAACSQEPIAHTSAFAWLPSSGNLLRERQRHISLLEREVAQKNQWLKDSQSAQSALQIVYDKLQAELDENHKRASDAIDQLRDELGSTRAGYEAQIARTEADAATRLEWIAGLHAEIDRLQVLLAERTDWAHSLEREMQQERVVYRDLEEQYLETLDNLKRTHAELENLRAELASTEATRWVRLGRSLSLMDPRPGDENG